VSEFTLTANPRLVEGRKVRNQGLVPGVVYGPQVKAFSIEMAYREVEVALMKAGSTNLIDLNVSETNYRVLAREVQRDPIRNQIKHVDFFAVDENSRIVIEVPIRLVGESPAVVSRRGILLTGGLKVRVEMLATKIIGKIELNLTSVPNVGDSIYVRQLELGEGYKILNDPEEMIVRIAQSSAARREEALKAAEATKATTGKKK